MSVEVVVHLTFGKEERRYRIASSLQAAAAAAATMAVEKLVVLVVERRGATDWFAVAKHKRRVVLKLLVEPVACTLAMHKEGQVRWAKAEMALQAPEVLAAAAATMEVAVVAGAAAAAAQAIQAVRARHIHKVWEVAMVKFCFHGMLRLPAVRRRQGQLSPWQSRRWQRQLLQRRRLQAFVLVVLRNSMQLQQEIISTGTPSLREVPISGLALVEPILQFRQVQQRLTTQRLILQVVVAVLERKRSLIQAVPRHLLCLVVSRVWQSMPTVPKAAMLWAPPWVGALEQWTDLVA
jgi:hypothetical protein